MFFIFISIPIFLKPAPSASFVEIAITSGFPFLICAFVAISTGVSVMPLHSFAAVLPVQGAITIISRKLLGPIGSAAQIVRIPSFPVISQMPSTYSFALPNRVSQVCALKEKTGMTFAPISHSRCISFLVFANVQKDPVIPSPILYFEKSITHSLPFRGAQIFQ